MILMSIVFFWCFQEEIVSEDLDITNLRTEFDTGVSLFNSIDQEQSTAYFEKVVSELAPQPERTDEETFMLKESLRYLGVITYPDRTEEYFERLIEIDPGYDMSLHKLSPKIVGIFDEIRQKRVGRIRLQISEPMREGGLLLDHAAIFVDDRLVGMLSGNTVVNVLAGNHEVRVEKPDYETLTASVSVPPAGEVPVTGVMARNAAELVFLTVPNGVKIFFDNVAQGETEGSAPVEYSENLLSLNISPEEASDTFSINGVQPGEYTIRFQKPCYRTQIKNVKVENFDRIAFRPVVMEPVYSFLEVTAPGEASGIVYLNQERRGALPLLASQECPGTYTLMVQFTDGQYIKEVTLEEGKTTKILAQPLPSIVWFGIDRSSDDMAADVAQVDQWLKSLKSWNVQFVDPNNTRLVPHDPFDLLFSEKQIVGEAWHAFHRSLNADLYMAARVVRKKVVMRFLEIALWTPLSQRISVYAIDFRELEKLSALLGAIDGPLALTQPWIGVQVAKIWGQQGCKVMDVNEDGPLSARAREGSIIAKIGGKLFNQPAQLYDLRAGQEVELEIGNEVVPVVPVNTIAALPYEPERVCPQAIIARLEKLSKYATATIEKQSAQFNLARYQFFLGDYQQAFDIFSTFRMDQPYGISQGTLFFYQGLCFRRLNLNEEAVGSFNSAMSYPQATLFDAYGPKVAFWAETQLKEMQALQ